MKKFITLFITLSNIAFSQLSNFNMQLIRNVDTRRVPSQYNPAWHYSACWGYTAPDGREYAILGCVLGTQIVDITDSENVREVYFKPANIDFNNFDPGFGWREMKVYSHYLYVISYADSSRLEIFDLQSLPDSARYVGKISLPGHSKTRTLSQSGPYLYLNGANPSFGQGTTILDLTNPEQPVKRSSWNNEYVHDSRVFNDTLFTANIFTGRLSIFDVADKDTVKFITSFQTIPNAYTHNCAITKDRKYIFTTDEIENPPGNLKIWNIEDLTDITFVRDWSPTGISNAVVHNVEIFGDTAVIAHFLAGIRVLNISNPVSPVEIGWYDTYPGSNTNQFGGCWAVFKFPSGKIIGSDMFTGLYVLEMQPTIGIQTISVEKPAAFNLEQNYPNPFNPNTTISYDLPENNFVLLKIYNSLGEEAATLVEKKQNAGSYNIVFEGSNFSSGVYFYSLFVGDNLVDTKQMFLIK